jgi:magnesium transporter
MRFYFNHGGEMMNAEITTLDLEALIEARDFASLREQIKNWPAGDLAELMEPLSAEKETLVFRLLPRDQAAQIFSYLPIERQEELLKAMAQVEVVNILNAMSDDDRTNLLEELPAKVTQQLLNSLSDEERQSAAKLLGYKENSVGRLMTPHFVRVKAHWTVEYALGHIRRYGMDSETMSMIYVIDENSKLIDDLRIRQFLLAQPDALVQDLMDSRFVALKATDDREVAVEAFKEADLIALPVTDSEGVLIGIVTVDDILDVAEEEATEDIQKMGGSEALDEPYMEIAIPSMVKNAPCGWWFYS